MRSFIPPLLHTALCGALLLAAPAQAVSVGGKASLTLLGQTLSGQFREGTCAGRSGQVFTPAGLDSLALAFDLAGYRARVSDLCLLFAPPGSGALGGTARLTLPSDSPLRTLIGNNPIEVDIAGSPAALSLVLNQGLSLSVTRKPIEVGLELTHLGLGYQSAPSVGMNVSGTGTLNIGGTGASFDLSLSSNNSLAVTVPNVNAEISILGDLLKGRVKGTVSLVMQRAGAYPMSRLRIDNIEASSATAVGGFGFSAQNLDYYLPSTLPPVGLPFGALTARGNMAGFDISVAMRLDKPDETVIADAVIAIATAVKAIADAGRPATLLRPNDLQGSDPATNLAKTLIALGTFDLSAVANFAGALEKPSLTLSAIELKFPSTLTWLLGAGVSLLPDPITIRPRDLGARRKLDVDVNVDSHSLKFSASVGVADFLGRGQGVTLAASMESPKFASALERKVGDLVGASGLFAKAMDLFDMGSPYPTIRHADLRLTLGGTNVSSTMSVKATVFGTDFTFDDIAVSLSDLGSAEQVASILAPRLVSKSMAIVEEEIRKFLSDPLKFLSGVAGKLGGEFNKAFAGASAAIGSVGDFLSGFFSSNSKRKPAEKPSPCTPQIGDSAGLIRHGDPLVFRMSDKGHYAGDKAEERKTVLKNMNSFMETRRRTDSPSCLSSENAILSGDYVDVFVRDLKSFKLIRQMKGQFYTEDYERTANTPYFAGESLIRFQECGSIHDSYWSDCNKWTIDNIENMVVLRHPGLLPTQKTQIDPPYEPKRSMNIFYGQPVLIDSSRGWESAGGPVRAAEMGIGALVFVPVPNTPLHGKSIKAGAADIIPVTHNDRVTVLEVDLTKYKFPNDTPALLAEYHANRLAGRFGTGTGQRATMVTDMYFVTLNETAMSEALYALDSGLVWLYDWREGVWATFGTYRNIKVYAVCTAIYQFSKAFGEGNHPLRQAGMTCAAK